MRNKDIRPEKIQMVDDLSRLIGSSETFFLFSYKGLKVDDFSRLRSSLAELQSECRVVPNRLFMRAVTEHGIKLEDGYRLRGDSALVTGGVDAAAVAKTTRKFAAANQMFQVKFGSISGQFIAPWEVDQLAQLPGRDIMLAQLLGVLQAPSRNLAGVLYNRVASVVYALDAHRQNCS